MSDFPHHCAATQRDLEEARAMIRALGDAERARSEEVAAATMRAGAAEAEVATLKARVVALEDRLRGLALAGKNLALATPDRVLRLELERAVRLAQELVS